MERGRREAEADGATGLRAEDAITVRPSSGAENGNTSRTNGKLEYVSTPFGGEKHMVTATVTYPRGKSPSFTGVAVEV